MAATSHTWVIEYLILSKCNWATEELNFNFNVFKFNLKSHTRLVVGCLVGQCSSRLPYIQVFLDIFQTLEPHWTIPIQEVFTNPLLDAGHHLSVLKQWR